MTQTGDTPEFAGPPAWGSPAPVPPPPAPQSGQPPEGHPPEVYPAAPNAYPAAQPWPPAPPAAPWAHPAIPSGHPYEHGPAAQPYTTARQPAQPAPWPHQTQPQPYPGPPYPGAWPYNPAAHGAPTPPLPPPPGYPPGPHAANAGAARPAPPPRRRTARRKAAWAAGIALTLTAAIVATTLAVPGLRHAIWDRDRDTTPATNTTPDDPKDAETGARGTTSGPNRAEDPRTTAALFIKTLGGTDQDRFNAVAVTPDGGIAAAGEAESDGGDFGPTKGGEDAAVARFGPDGELEWTKTLGGTDDDGFSAVAVTPDSGLAAVGTTLSGDGDFGPTNGGQDAVLARFEPNGELEWAKTLGGTGEDRLAAVAVTPDGGLVAAGHTDSDGGDFGPTNGGQDAVLVRFGPDGRLRWTRTLGGTDDDRFVAVAVTPDGGFAAVGITSSGDGDFGPTNGGWDAVLARFGPDGELEWTKTLGGTDWDRFNSVAVTAGGGIAAAGDTNSSGGDFGPTNGGWDAVLARFGPDGELEWTKTLGGAEEDRFYAVAVTLDGGIAAVGDTYSDGGNFGPAKGGRDAVVARFGPDGELEWTKTLGGADDDWFNEVAVAPDGGLAISGTTISDGGDLGPTKGESDAVVARFDQNGELAPS